MYPQLQAAYLRRSGGRKFFESHSSPKEHGFVDIGESSAADLVLPFDFERGYGPRLNSYDTATSAL